MENYLTQCVTKLTNSDNPHGLCVVSYVIVHVITVKN